MALNAVQLIMLATTACAALSAVFGDPPVVVFGITVLGAFGMLLGGLLCAHLERASPASPDDEEAGP